jgi:hypothetical protein
MTYALAQLLARNTAGPLFELCALIIRHLILLEDTWLPTRSNDLGR